MLNSLLGVQIIVSDHLPTDKKQVRFPRSKRKRIRCKWAKQEKNYVRVEHCVQIGNTVFVTRAMLETLQRKVMGSIEVHIIQGVDWSMANIANSSSTSCNGARGCYGPMSVANPFPMLKPVIPIMAW